MPAVSTLKFDSRNTTTPVPKVITPVRRALLARPELTILLTMALTPPENRIKPSKAPMSRLNKLRRALPGSVSLLTALSIVARKLINKLKSPPCKVSKSSDVNKPSSKPETTSLRHNTNSKATMGGNKLSHCGNSFIV